MNDAYGAQPVPPPAFEEAKNMRQRTRAAGMNPNYWYAVELEKDLKKGEVKEVVFWKRSIALFRSMDGEIHAIDNRCAHRQLKLTTGHVDGCNLVCPYHGWEYDGDGKVAHIPHDLFGRSMPNFRVRKYPVKTRYGLIFLFPGDPELSTEVHIPDIPELEGPDRWACVPIASTWNAHHSMIIDNVSDFTHAYLHRKYKPFDQSAKLTRCETVGDNVYVSYDTKVGGGRFSQFWVDRRGVDTNHMELCYEYPYQWSNTDDHIRHWLFVLPMDERTTRSFFLFHFKKLKVPGLPIALPRNVMERVIKVANKIMVEPLLAEDGFAVEAEQEGYDRHWDAPLAELNPAVRAFQEVTIRKWDEYLQSEQAKGKGKTTKRAAPKSKKPSKAKASSAA